MNEPTTERRQRLWALIKDMRFGMFTTQHADGHLYARPMTTQNQKIDEDDTLWFFMPRSGEPARDLAHDAQVNVAYASPDDDSYVSVSGTAEIVDDAATKRRLWSKLNEAWFPNGPDDPDVALVRVRISCADYWDVKSSKVVQLYKMARAAIGGRPPTDMGEHGEVQMR